MRALQVPTRIAGAVSGQFDDLIIQDWPISMPEKKKGTRLIITE